MKNKFASSIIIAWLSFFCAPVALVIGHTGAHDLHWIRNQISSFAARAPHGDWITCSMLLTALGLLCIGIALSKCQAFVQGFVKQIMSMLIGTSISGLLILAVYKETAMSLGQLKNMPLKPFGSSHFTMQGC